MATPVAKTMVGGPLDGEIIAFDDSTITFTTPVVDSKGKQIVPQRWAKYIKYGTEQMIWIGDSSEIYGAYSKTPKI